MKMTVSESTLTFNANIMAQLEYCEVNGDIYVKIFDKYVVHKNLVYDYDDENEEHPFHPKVSYIDGSHITIHETSDYYELTEDEDFLDTGETIKISKNDLEYSIKNNLDHVVCNL